MGSYVKTPKWLSCTGGVLNIKPGRKTRAKSNVCFLLNVYASLHPCKRKNPQRASNYERYFGTLNETHISCPIKKSEISQFEKANSHITVNLFALHIQKGKKPLVFPFRISSNRGPDKHVVNMLVLESGDPNKDAHLLLIKDLSALTNQNQTKHCGKTWTCCFCLFHIPLKAHDASTRIASHTEMCVNFNPMTISYPPAGSVLKFEEHYKCIEVPYFILFDYESMDRLVQHPENKKEAPLPPHLPRKFAWIRYQSHHDHICW